MSWLEEEENLIALWKIIGKLMEFYKAEWMASKKYWNILNKGNCNSDVWRKFMVLIRLKAFENYWGN